MKHKYFIDSHKGLTGPYILALGIAKSLSRYPEFAAYKSNTKLIIPYLV